MDDLIDEVYRVHDSDGDVVAYMNENGIPMTPELFAGVLKRAREAREAVELRLLRKLEELRCVLFERAATQGIKVVD